jgi:uncharacterized protein (TIGR02145 family)
LIMKINRRFLSIAIMLIAVFGIIITSCKPEEPELMVATSSKIVSGGGQTAQVETALPNEIVIMVQDQEGNGFKGVTVKFSTLRGNVSNESTTTDAEGKASTRWTLGAVVGKQTLTVKFLKADGTLALSSLIVDATGTPKPPQAATIELVSASDIEGIATRTLTDPIVVMVRDQFENPFEGAKLSYTVTEGSVSPEIITTDAEGKASASWTLGATIGTQTLSVKVFKADGSTVVSTLNVNVNAKEGVPTIERVSGNNQEAVIFTELQDEIVVLAKDPGGNPYKGVEVTFTVANGSVSPIKAITDDTGKASTKWTLGSIKGSQTLEATIQGGLAPVSFTATGKAITVTDIDGNTYSTVTIGNQVWMAENLKVTKYPNGDAIPHVTNSADWKKLGDNDTDDAYCAYDDNEGMANYYGYLYTYSAAIGDNWERDNVDKQGICPDGWHLPSDSEWLTLENEVDTGGDVSPNNGERGTDVGMRLKESGTIYWAIDAGADANSSGFNGRGSGQRTNQGGSIHIKLVAVFWMSKKQSNTKAYMRVLRRNKPLVGRYSMEKSRGYSIRCVKN